MQDRDLGLPSNAPEDLVHRAERHLAAETFLKRVLIPQIDEGTVHSPEHVKDLFSAYVEETNSDIDIASVWKKSEVESIRNEALNLSGADNISDNAASMKVAESLLKRATFGDKEPPIELDY